MNNETCRSETKKSPDNLRTVCTVYTLYAGVLLNVIDELLKRTTRMQPTPTGRDFDYHFLVAQVPILCG